MADVMIIRKVSKLKSMRKLTNLKKLKIIFKTGADAELLYGEIVNLNCLHHLGVRMSEETRANEVLSIWESSPILVLSFPNLSHLLKLSKVYLYGKLETLPEIPTNLTKLTLEDSGLKEDPMATLEKLKNLRILRWLGRSYVAKEMACSAQGFPQLKSSHLEGLSLLEWKVNEGSMPSLLHLRIYGCYQLKKLPEGLQQVTTLKKLELWSMPDEFNARVQGFKKTGKRIGIRSGTYPPSTYAIDTEKLSSHSLIFHIFSS